MRHSIGRTAMAQVQSLLCGFLQDGAFPFSSVLTVQDIVDRISQTCVETCDRIFTPVVTLCTFLSQIHSGDPSCRAAVARLNATRVAQGLAPCSPLTGGLQGAPTSGGIVVRRPDAPERPAAPATGAPGLARAWTGGQD